MPEIRRAHDGVDNRENDQDHGDHSKSRKGIPSRQVAFGSLGIFIHADKLEKKVGQSPEIKSLSDGD